MKTTKLSIKQKQWLWFIGLWCASLLAMLVLAKSIKFFMGI